MVGITPPKSEDDTKRRHLPVRRYAFRGTLPYAHGVGCIEECFMFCLTLISGFALLLILSELLLGTKPSRIPVA